MLQLNFFIFTLSTCLCFVVIYIGFDNQFLSFILISISHFWPCHSLSLHQLLCQWVTSWLWFNFVVHVICQVAYLADACNVTNVHQCNYYCSLNKLCHPVSSMQDIGESLMSKRFCPTTTLYFVMQCREPSPMSFKLTKLLLWSVARLHLWCACMSQL